MSRIGKRITIIPAGVTISLSGSILTVKGPKGTLSMSVPEHIEYRLDGDKAQFILDPVYGEALNVMHGTTSARFAGIVKGVTETFTKRLEIVGVGYKASVDAVNLTLSVGYSHPVLMKIPEGMKVEVTENVKIAVSGADSVALGQFAQNVRKVRVPDHYKGKGIRYAGEKVKIKPGKKALSGS
ncbi:MAG: 50S ribosomal protein L6 [Caldisericota bacterium]|jgi:large subunit ribosomal protein L6|nr:50S ribosomal protein L6 [Caldisericota bacterium]